MLKFGILPKGDGGRTGLQRLCLNTNCNRPRSPPASPSSHTECLRSSTSLGLGGGFRKRAGKEKEGEREEGRDHEGSTTGNAKLLNLLFLSPASFLSLSSASTKENISTSQRFDWNMS